MAHGLLISYWGRWRPDCAAAAAVWYATQYGPYTVTKPEDYPAESDSIHAPQLAIYSSYLEIMHGPFKFPLAHYAESRSFLLAWLLTCILTASGHVGSRDQIPATILHGYLDPY
ncbi:predicted protein [Histoplasma capsulatum var. duboisii H88]|uniref:Predicted protein n=2 Tax=Ajellomyces capsulatus TaxID=5037 RepID=F0UHM4_AJEC8|nr:predicted protein [Histoplasma capsulatum H143]EGC45435.1 predicted protein [Histoplasma capsulatum var. duboisii H88]